MITLPFLQYETSLQTAFTDYLLSEASVNSKAFRSIRFSTTAPDEDRLKRDLTRYRQSNSFPDNWCIIQWLRTPLVIDPEDEFRTKIVRDTGDSSGGDEGAYSEKHFGFATSDLTFTLWANNGTTIEACEVLYYYHMYKIKNVSYTYESESFRSRLIHEVLGSFGSQGITDFGTLFRIDWTVKFFVPLLIDSKTGKVVLTIKTDVYTHDHDADLDDETEIDSGGDLAFSFTEP